VKALRRCNADSDGPPDADERFPDRDFAVAFARTAAVDSDTDYEEDV
jgi:hypothetical protein